MKTKKLNIMTKCRIIERTSVDGRKSYVIQQKHFLFRWLFFLCGYRERKRLS